ncbi:hypothetical protein [Sanguibacter inulinus]|uniref:Restriction endonuclease n=1 Tax=Sanguibacter inulinus TaxID=60922 RepID=A0A853EX29_9MICO|nr:hypothetical protein [Sanguibacter inulinus]MBF0724052.1 hypothetical protein [Sanguibacter inulinus]NYS95197.1 hypothetical protein [Sanguibacter inulinus]
MSLEKLPRNAAMDGIDLYRRLDTSARDTEIADPARVDAVVGDIRATLLRDLRVESTVNGWRTQALFASLIASLDSCNLMTFVDTGDIYFDGDSVKAPDYFLSLKDGRRLLVDVKAVRGPRKASLDEAVKFSASEVRRLRRFGELYGVDVFLAIYHSEMFIWSLVSIDDLDRGVGGGFRISLHDCIMLNQFSILGDVQVGSEFPIEMVIRSDGEKWRDVGDDGRIEFTIGAVDFFVASEPLVLRHEKSLAYFLMMYGGWDVDRVDSVSEEGVVEIRFSALPEERDLAPQMHGPLSTMHSRRYDLATKTSLGVVALDVQEGLGDFEALLPQDYQSITFPIWRFVLKPNVDARRR